MSLDRMTIRTPNLALCDFSFSLSKAFCITHIQHLVANMVKVKRVRVRFVPTIYATGFDLKSIKPAPYGRSPFICNSVHMLSVARFFQSGNSPFFDFFFWGWRSDTRSVLTQGRTEFRRSFCSECATTLLAFKHLFIN